MKKNIVSCIDLYYGEVGPSSLIDFYKEEIKFSILESFHKKEFFNQSHNDYTVHSTPEFQKFINFINDDFYYVNFKKEYKDWENEQNTSVKQLVEKNRFGNVYLPNESSLIRNNVDKNKRVDSPDYTLVYAVSAVDQCSNLIIKYDDNTKKDCSWNFPIKNGYFFIFPSNLDYYITKNTSNDLSVYLTINYYYILNR